jgi:hypothetical protein
MAGGRCLVNEATPHEITVDEICDDYAKHAKAFYRKKGKSIFEWLSSLTAGDVTLSMIVGNDLANC